MNYQKIYNQIIERAKERILEGYKEKHHILPKSLGGSNKKENLVFLTAREHFLCHLLLVEIYPESDKLKYAAWAMAHQNTSKQQRSYKISSRTYERLKKNHSKLLTIRNTGHKPSAETIEKIRNSNLGRKATQEQKEQMSLIRKGKKKNPYKPKELKFEHICEACNQQFKSADVRGRFCKACKEPRECKCGCGKLVKTPGRFYYPNCMKRGKNYEEIYGTGAPKNGFKKGNKFGK